MVKSMTGYGRGEAQTGQYSLVVETKAVNHRFLEVVIRSPRQLNQLDDAIRKTIQSRLNRGRIDVFISLEESEEKKSQLKVDKELALAYYNSLLAVKQACQLAEYPTLELIAAFPGVITTEKSEDDLEALAAAAGQALSQALDSLLLMRETEGAALDADVRGHAAKVAELTAGISAYREAVVEEYRQKLAARIADILDGIEVDEARLASEVAFFADKSDISEELARMDSHQKQLRETLGSAELIGRKLEFILQEMNREINTIGSKSNNTNISGLVIEAKSVLEKIREQIQNIE